jgi:zinc-binding in reverse transcriptase
MDLTCVATRAQALLAKQACHRIAGGSLPAAHIAYWLGLRLRHHLPALAAGHHPEAIPASYAALGHLLLEVLDLEDVEAAALGAVEAKSLYAAFTDTLPPPKVEVKHPDIDWRKVWSRLVTPGLPPLAVDTAFSMLHNILPLQVRRHRLQLAESPACRRCGAPVEDALHFFTACPCVVDAWVLCT